MVKVPYRLFFSRPVENRKRAWVGGKIVFISRGIGPDAHHDISYELSHDRREISPLVAAAIDKFERDGITEGILTVE